MAGAKPTTIREVARAAAVSTQTVSRVVNNHPDVATETRQRVQQIIAQLGYQPNAIARSLIQRRSHTLGIIAAELDRYGPQRALTGIERQAATLGYSLHLSLVDDESPADITRQLNTLLSQRVDGIVWAVPHNDHHHGWLQSKLQQLAVPVVCLGIEVPSELPSVSANNQLGGQLATQHLIDGGRRWIGLVTGPLAWAAARNRRHGWYRALTATELSADERLIVEGDWTAPSGEQGLYRLLEQVPDIDAVFASNDQMALGVLQALHRIGRRVPQDVAVVGYDNMPESAYFWPPLTTVQQHVIDQASHAVQAIDRLIQRSHNGEQHDHAEHVVIEPHLIVRASSTIN